MVTSSNDIFHYPASKYSSEELLSIMTFMMSLGSLSTCPLLITELSNDDNSVSSVIFPAILSLGTAKSNASIVILLYKRNVTVHYNCQLYMWSVNIPHCSLFHLPPSVLPHLHHLKFNSYLKQLDHWPSHFHLPRHQKSSQILLVVVEVHHSPQQKTLYLDD